MAEDVNLEDNKTIEEFRKGKALVRGKTLLEIIEERKKKSNGLRPYTYLDAVARQGSHVGIPTTRP
jgi:hypothetical protein